MRVEVRVKKPCPSDFLAFVQKLRTCRSLFFKDQPCRPEGTSRVCKTEALFLRSLADKLSPETVYSIGDFAAPATSPSAQALKDIQVVYPWIEPMRRATLTCHSTRSPCTPSSKASPGVGNATVASRQH